MGGLWFDGVIVHACNILRIKVRGPDSTLSH